METEDSGITGEQLVDTSLSLSDASPGQSRKIFPNLMQAVVPNATSAHLSNSSTTNCTGSSCIVNNDSAVRPVGNRFDGTFSSQKSNLQTEFSQVLMKSIPAAVEPSQVLSQLPINDKQELVIEENKSTTVTVTEINDKDGLTHNEVPSANFGNNLESKVFAKLKVLDALNKGSQKSKSMWCSASVGSRAVHQKEEFSPLVENFLCKDESKSNDKVRSISVGTNGSHSNDKHISPTVPRAVLSLSSGRRHSSLSPRPRFLLNASQNDRRNSFCTSSFFRPSMWWCPEDQSSFGSHMFQAPSGSMRRQLHTIDDGGKGRGKPPGILIFTGDNEELFNHISGVLASMISPDTYTVFHLSYEALCKQPWIGREAACLIVADTAHLDDKCWARLHQYFNNSGKMLFLCQNNLLASLCACDTSKKSAKLLKMAFGERQSKELGKDFENFLKKTLRAVRKGKKVNQTFHAKDLIGGYKYSVALCKNEDSPLLLYMENAAQQASALFSDATSEQLLSSGTELIADALSRLSIETVPLAHLPTLTQGYFICEYDRMPWDMQGMRFDEKFGTLPKLLLKQIKKHGPLPEPSKELLPVEVRTRMEHLPGFDDEIYFRRLKTPKLGKALFYVPVCETTMEIGKSLAFAMPEEPVVVVAQQQIKGRGRSGNQWLSPVGCAMFTFNYMLPVGSNLVSNVSFIQHILCVAVVDGIRSLHKDLENFPLKIKWPNDVYYGRTHKMGGLIVNATTIDGRTVCTLGAGLNLANSKPTVCINDLLPTEVGFKIKREDYIANTLNKFEYYMDIYQNLGQEAFLKHYYRFWLHSREEVTLSDTNEKAVIRGLDQYGFLEVRSRQSGQIMAVHPDGNTFDMMKGLITAKYR